MTPLHPLSTPDTSSPSRDSLTKGLSDIELYKDIPSSIKEKWDAYIHHVRKWFHSPDEAAVRAVLSACAAHFHKESEPCWLFVLGPPAGDKSSLCINSALDFPQIHKMGDLTSKTFLSGYTGTLHPGLLDQIGSSGILAFKDFTTYLSKPKEEQDQITSQMREIYDGSFNKNTGKGAPQNWIGKITVIAACTMDLEQAWSSKNSMGERFIAVKIKRKDGVAQAKVAMRQRGMEGFISSTMRNLAREFFQATPPIINPPPPLSEEQLNRLAHAAEFVCYARGVIPRLHNTGIVIGEARVENTGRISKQLAALAANHAALFRRPYVSEYDMSLAIRVAQDSIPQNRYDILKLVPIKGSIAVDRLRLHLRLPEETVSYHIRDMESLGVIEVRHNQVLADEVSFTPGMGQIWEVAFEPPLPRSVLLPSQSQVQSQVQSQTVQ